MGLKASPETLEAIERLKDEGMVEEGPKSVLSDPGASEGRSKYGSVPTEVDGERFDSKKEARRWSELRLLEQGGKISNLQRQVPLPLYSVGGDQIATYYADFVYVENGEVVIEDVKSEPTRKKEVYRLKKRWVKSQYKREIRET